MLRFRSLSIKLCVSRFRADKIAGKAPPQKRLRSQALQPSAT